MAHPESTFTREETHAWLLKFHAASAALDAQHWLSTFWTTDAVLQFANYPEIHGREAITENFRVQFATLELMEHEVLDFDVVAGNKIYQKTKITYVVSGDEEKKRVVVPGFAVFYRRGRGEVEEGKMGRFEVYLDPAPLVERHRVVAAARAARS